MEEEKYFLSVGDPWDFESPDGQNIIRGNILNIKSDKCIVFKSNHYLQFDDVKGNILILFPRYQGDNFLNFENEIIAFNGNVMLIDYNEQLCEKELLKNTKFVIIGTIRKDNFRE